MTIMEKGINAVLEYSREKPSFKFLAQTASHSNKSIPVKAYSCALPFFFLSEAS